MVCLGFLAVLENTFCGSSVQILMSVKGLCKHAAARLYLHHSAS